MGNRSSHSETKRQPVLNNSTKLLGIHFFPVLGIAGSITYTLLIIAGWILIAVVGSNLFKLVGANFQIIFVALVIILVGQATISFLNIQLHVPHRKSLSSYAIVFVLSVIYWLLFVASSVGQFNAWSSSPPPTDDEEVLWFALAYVCITPMFIGLLIGQIVGYNKLKFTQSFNSKHIILSSEGNENMEAALVTQTMGFLTAVGGWAMSELSEIWKIRRQKDAIEKVDKSESTDLMIDLSNEEQIKENLEVALIDAAKYAGELKFKDAVETIRANYEQINLEKKRQRYLRKHTTTGRESPVDADMQMDQIHENIVQYMQEIEQSINVLGLMVDKKSIAKD